MVFVATGLGLARGSNDRLSNDPRRWRWMVLISFSGLRALEIRWVSVCACADVEWGFLHLPFISTRTLQQSLTAFTTTFQHTTHDNEIKQGCTTVLLRSRADRSWASTSVLRDQYIQRSERDQLAVLSDRLSWASVQFVELDV